MASLLTVIENMERQRGLSGGDDSAMRVVRNGLNAHPDFWRHFMSVTSDADGVANLLGVPRERVTRWRGMVEEAMNRVRRSDDESSRMAKAKPISTGGVAEPMDSSKSPPADLRPTP